MKRVASDFDLHRISVERLHELQRVRGTALVTITQDTTEGQRLSSPERARLSRLLADAASRVQREPGGSGDVGFDPSSVVAALRPQQMGAGLVILIGAGTAEAFRLSTAPGDRVVVDPTFATRDLLFDLWSAPELLVLTVSGREARLFVDDGIRVNPLAEGQFPLRAELAERERLGRKQKPSRRRTNDAERFLVAVGEALAEVADGRPVVLLAAEPVASIMRRLSPVAFLALVPGNRVHASPLELAALVEPVRRRHLDGLRADGQRRRRDVGRSRVAVGVAEVLEASRRGRVESLLVDRDFRVAGRSGEGGFVSADDPTTPGVVDDVIDDVIENVVARGGSVFFLESGDLGQAGIEAILDRPLRSA